MGDDKPPPPSPAAEGGAAFAGNAAEGELTDNQTSTTDVGIDGSDPTYSSRATTAEKYGRANDHPHMAYIYRGRGTSQPQDESGVGEEEGEVRVTFYSLHWHWLAYPRTSVVDYIVLVWDAVFLFTLSSHNII